MQDKYGRPLSDDGRWFWDGSNWQPTGDGGGAAGAGGQSGGSPGLEPTMVAPVDYQPTGGQPPQPYEQQVGYPYPTGAPQGPYGPGQGGPYGPGRPPGGGAPTPFYKKPWAIVAALLAVSGVVVVVILLARGGGNNTAGPGPSVGPTVIPTALPSSEQPTTEPTSEQPTEEPSQVPNDEIASGQFECTSGGSVIGTVDFTGTDYTTSTGATGTYEYDASSGDISFSGADLGPYSGTYDPNGPSMDLTTSSGGQLHCAQ